MGEIGLGQQQFFWFFAELCSQFHVCFLIVLADCCAGYLAVFGWLLSTNLCHIRNSLVPIF